MIYCPNCNKKIETKELLEKAKIAFVLPDGTGYTYDCPDCGNKIMFETVPRLHYDGRCFCEFQTKGDNNNG
jgi:DNA-directed RNA polymerase subunit RPC12/RpoP